MEFEFDKEIDALLRQAAREGGTAFSATNPNLLHLDADEISLFAENALPIKGRANATEHLANCRRCRKILSNVISLNGGAQSEMIHAKKTKVVLAAPPTAWHKRLFAFPQMSYALAAMALLFTGIIGFVVLQNSLDSQNASVAKIEQISERPQGATGASSEGETVSSESFSANAQSNTILNSNSAMSNASTMATSTSDSLVAANSNASTAREEKKAAAEKDSKTDPKVPATTDEMAAPVKKEVLVAADALRSSNADNDQAAEAEKLKDAKPKAEPTQNTLSQNQPSIASGTQNVQRSTPPASSPARARSEALQTQDAGKTLNERNDKASEMRSTGGKTFRRSGGTWIDSAYNGQATTKISRRSEAYKKLDAGLRSIADNLGGSVIVVWGGKAYRIQ